MKNIGNFYAILLATSTLLSAIGAVTPAASSIRFLVVPCPAISIIQFKRLFKYYTTAQYLTIALHQETSFLVL